MGRRTAVAVAVVAVALTFAIGAKRRSVRAGSCAGPSLNLTASPGVACPADAVTVTWRASDNKAVVTIDGIGDKLFATGSMRITTGQRSFTGYATNACGRGPSKSIDVTAPPPPSGSMSAPSTVKQYATATLRITAIGSSFWTLSSALSNPIEPSSGFGSDEVTYTASRTGTDGILLRINGQCGATADRTISLVVEPSTAPPPPPPPPPGGGYLRCCDNTFSKTCTSCAKKQGCCSGHGGVCGCG